MEVVYTNLTTIELQEAILWCKEQLDQNSWHYSLDDDYSQYTWYFAFDDPTTATYFRLKFTQNK